MRLIRLKLYYLVLFLIVVTNDGFAFCALDKCITVQASTYFTHFFFSIVFLFVLF